MFLTSFHRAIRYRKEFSFSVILLLSLQFLHFGLIFSFDNHLFYQSQLNQKDGLINFPQHNLDDECILIDNLKTSAKAEQSFTKIPFITTDNSENFISRCRKKYFSTYSVSSVSIVFKYSIPRSPPLLII